MSAAARLAAKRCTFFTHAKPFTAHSRKGQALRCTLPQILHVDRRKWCCTATALPAECLTSEQEERLRAFMDILLEQNKVMNLTAVRSVEEAWERHVQDSLALIPVIETNLAEQLDSPRVIDIGSGAGLPGLVLAITRPHWQMTLLDSLQKRCKFLESTVESLALENVSVVWGRAEKAAHDPALREMFDVALARAVAELRVLSELSLPFLRVKGVLVAAKGAQPQEEVEAAGPAISLLGGQEARTVPVHSHGPDGQRTAVVVQKTCSTPQQYPRREGRPQKQPL